MTRPICPECGGPLPVGAPEGTCPKCLLMLGVDESVGNIAPALPETPAADQPPENAARTEQSGQRIGRYKLLETIGEGGFGTVWMAEQQEPVRRKVALKIIKLGMDTKQVVARFEAERQALALMDHPNIARVFDGGATDNGRPYFVMELVRGIPITTYCDTAKLTTRERLELFIHVCQAVQHAHQKGIIHRDLKPSNILVTEQDGRAVPKVIDFGIAKATGGELTDKTLFTQFNQLIGTPAYMSPEQAGLGKLDIDTRSDIYSLGVLLYELMTGRTPLDPQKLREAGYEAMLKTIREVEPVRPSTRLTQDWALAKSALRIPHSAIDPDLDWIVLKALEKDRARRYETANGLAADLQRYLNNEPIVARPPSNFYRFQKLARRNKLLFGATAAVAAALVVGIVLASWQAVRATRNLAQARLNAYVSEVSVAQLAIAENNLGRTGVLLDRQRPKPGEEDLRGFEWRYLWHLTQASDETTFRDVGAGTVAFSPDGKVFAYGNSQKVMVRDIVSHQVVTNLAGPALKLSFSPHDKLLAIAEWAQVRLLDTQTWREVRPPLPNTKFPAIFSPDGKWLVTAAAETQTNEFQLWDTATWEVVGRCPAASPTLDAQHRHSTVSRPTGNCSPLPG